MNRIAIAIVLGVVAIAAAIVWSIGQFGGGSAVESEPRPPIVREPKITTPVVQSADPQANALPSPGPGPATPPEPTTDPATLPPERTTRTAPASDTFRSQLKPEDSQASQDPAPPQAAETDPATAAQPPQTATAEPRVAPQRSTSAAAAPSGLEAQFKSRRVTYNRPPEKLAAGKPVDVSLVINATDDAEAGREALDGFKGEIVERDVELSDTVSAQLTGVGFDITSQTVERQRLSGRTINRWQWRVTPTEPGTHTLILEIFGYASGSLDAEPLDAYRDVITVEVEQLDQIVSWARGVQPVFAVLAALAGIGSAVFAFLRFREEKKQTKAAGKKE